MTPAEELAAAADRIDKLLARIDFVPVPWRLGAWATAYDASGAILAESGYVGESGNAVVAYLVAMNPDVGRALVALLRQAGGDAARFDIQEWPEQCANLRDLARAILAPKETS